MVYLLPVLALNIKSPMLKKRSLIDNAFMHQKNVLPFFKDESLRLERKSFVLARSSGFPGQIWEHGGYKVDRQEGT